MGSRPARRGALRKGPRRIPALALLIAACGHSESYKVTAIPDNDLPLSTDAPSRLTFDPGMDRFPSHSNDGTTLWYSFQSPIRQDGDRCLARIPAAGGTRTEFCLDAIEGLTRRDAFDMPSPGPGGQLIYVRYASDIGAFLPDSGTILLATEANPMVARPLLRLPTAIDGIGFTYTGRIRWLTPDHIVFVGEDMSVRRICGSCATKDTIYRGAGLIDGRITATGATFAFIPGTLFASDFDFSSGRDSLYFTATDDDPVTLPRRGHVLFAIPLAGGVPRVVFATVPGDTLYSVARTTTRFAVTTKSQIISVDPAAGTSFTLAGPTYGNASKFGLASASPDGCRLTAEFRFPLVPTYTTDLFRFPSGVSGCPP